MGIVYYANYLVWFEMGRTDFCRKVGFTYKDMEQNDGLFIGVAEVKCRYHAPSTYDENLLLRTCLKACRTRLLAFGYEIYRQDGSELITTGETVHIVTDRSGRPHSLPKKYYTLLSNAVLKDGGKARRTVHE